MGNAPAINPASRFSRVLIAASDHSELIFSVIFVIVLAIWAAYIPRPGQIYVDPHLKEAAEKSGPDQQSYKIDLEVWTRYEEDITHYKWGLNVNLFLYSSLKTLAIILSAVTPALIVAPSLKDKKVLVAIPAVIVAVATGLIGEFDFKAEAARFDAAVVLLQTEKLMFITRGGPFYSDGTRPCTQGSRGSPSQSNSSSNPIACSPDLSLLIDETDVPFLPPRTAIEARTNFAYRIEKVRQAVATQRDQFLLGKAQQAAAAAEKPKAPTLVSGGVSQRH